MNVTPAGYTSVAPWIVTSDSRRLLDFITDAFDGVDPAIVPLEDGTIGHAEIRIGDTVVLAFDQRDGWPDTPSFLRVWVQDADLALARDTAAGARIVTGAATSAFGQRGARMRDPWATSGGSLPWSNTSASSRACAECPNPASPRPCAMPKRPSIMS